MGFGGPQANVSTGGDCSRGSALPVLGNRCLAGITVSFISLVADNKNISLMNAIYFHFQGLALKVIRCASVGGFLETWTEGPTGTPVLLLRCRVCDGFQTYLADTS